MGEVQGLTSTSLKITSLPAGEAPMWVREQWIGLLLPLAQRSLDPHVFITAGVLSVPEGRIRSLIALLRGKFKRESGYLVECITAVDVLSKVSPEAANWWHENTPHLMKKGRYFVFHKSAGHVQAGSSS